ncbi:MAG: hypothetical protein RLZZ217_1471, partial [Planctomycetota bacterium]
TFLLAVGANAWFHDDDNRRADGDTFAQASYGVDLTAMWDGWFFTGEAHWRDSAQRNSTAGTPAVTTSYDDIGTDGWFAQLGYCIIPQKFDVGFRWSEVDFDNTTASTSISEMLLTVWDPQCLGSAAGAGAFATSTGAVGGWRSIATGAVDGLDAGSGAGGDEHAPSRTSARATARAGTPPVTIRRHPSTPGPVLPAMRYLHATTACR